MDSVLILIFRLAYASFFKESSHPPRLRTFYKQRDCLKQRDRLCYRSLGGNFLQINFIFCSSASSSYGTIIEFPWVLLGKVSNFDLVIRVNIATEQSTQILFVLVLHNRKFCMCWPFIDLLVIKSRIKSFNIVVFGPTV